MTMDMCEKRQSEIDRLWSDLLPSWSGVVGGVSRQPGEVEGIPGVPAAWVAMFREGDRMDNATAPWRAMARFHRYLQASLIDVGVGTGIGGPVLVYLVRDWNETAPGEYEAGLMIGGAPTHAEVLYAFERESGEIPSSLRTAWLAHAFLLLKNGRWLGSLRREGTVISRPPAKSARPLRGLVGGVYGEFECLEVFDPGSPVSGCIVRRPGEQVWGDHVVYFEGRKTIVDSHRSSIESTLTDWETSEWSGQ
jgi:hypothetical protein